MPAFIIRSITSWVLDAGPIVQTILVLLVESFMIDMFSIIYIRKLKSSDLNISSYQMLSNRSSASQHLYPELLQALRDRIQRQAHNVEKISLDPIDDYRTETLYAVGSRFIEGFAGFDVRLYLFFI